MEKEQQEWKVSVHKHKNFFLKNKFATLRDSAKGKNLSGFNLATFCVCQWKKNQYTLIKSLDTQILSTPFSTYFALFLFFPSP